MARPSHGALLGIISQCPNDAFAVFAPMIHLLY